MKRLFIVLAALLAAVPSLAQSPVFQGLRLTGSTLTLDTIASGKLLGVPGAVAGVVTGVEVGDPLSGGLLLDTISGRFTGTAPTTYYLTKVSDASGIATYYTAQRNLSALDTQETAAALTGTTLTTVANFVTPPGDPGSIAYAPGTYSQYVYISVDDASAQFTVSVRPYARNIVTGVETNLGTGTTATLTGFTPNTPTGVRVIFRKQSASALNLTDRLVFRVMATRVGGPATINLKLHTDGTTYRSTVSTNITGTGQTGPDYVLNVVDFGAKRDAISQPDGVITSGTNILTSALASFKPADVGKSIEVNDMLGTGGTPFIGTIAGYTDAHTVTLSGNATASTTGIRYLTGARRATGGAIGNYLQNDQVCLVGGTYTVQACLSVTSTSVAPDTETVPAFGIVNAGSGGKDGIYFLTGTTGTGTKFRARGTFSGGALIGVQSFNGGVYLTNPSNLANEPVTTTNGATGIVLSIGRMDAQVLAWSVAGSYSVLPDEPVETTAGSLSGATGLTLDPAWQSVGRFTYFTNDNAAFAAAITRANAFTPADGRAVINVPAGNYGITGTALPVMTKPILFRGDGRSQSQISVAQGYTGAHILGWSGNFPNAIDTPPPGPTVMFSSATNGWGASGLSFYGNRYASNLPDALILYDLNAGGRFENIAGYDVGSLLHVGVLLNNNIAYSRESSVSDYFCQSCGGTGRPVVWFDAYGRNAKNNNWQLNQGNIVFPLGPGVTIESHAYDVSSGSKAFDFGYLRIERGASNTGAFGTGDLIQIGSPDSTDEVQGVNFGTVWLVAPQSGGNAIAFYGTTETARPHDITIDGFGVFGQSLGGGINIQAGYNLYITVDNNGARGGQVVTGPRTDNRLVTTAASGSSTSAVKLSTGSAVDSFYNGGALVATIPASFTASINSGGTMTVSAIASGRIVVGTIVTGGGVRPVKRVTALGTGTGGTGTYSVNNDYPQTLGSRAMAGIFTESRAITGYTGSTKTVAVGALQGSAATFTYAPQAGDALAVQSLIEPDLFFNGYGREPGFDWSGVGANVGSVISTPVFVRGLPTGTGIVDRRLNLSAGVQIGPGTVPAAANDNCAAGDIAWDATYEYKCIATNTWVRKSVGSTWP